MLTNIALENYKVFKELHNLKIKPITVLCGANSCGKSSILQSILLLKQTFESRQLNSGILLNGELLHVGFPQSIVYQRNLSNEVKIEFSFNTLGMQKDIRTVASFFFRASEKNGDRISDIKINLTMTLQWKKVSQKIQKEKLIVKKWKAELTPISKNDHLEESSQKFKRIYDFEYIRQREYRFLFHENEKSFDQNVSLRFFSLFPSIDMRSFISKENEHDTEIFSKVFLDLDFLKDILYRLWKTVQFIGPLREEPSRRYIYDNEVTEIGMKGENAAYIYFSEEESEIQDVFFYSENTCTYENKGKMKLKEAVNMWLDCMGIRNFKTDYSQDIIYLNMDATPTDATEVNIADVGFGVSQIFPIVLEGLRMGTGHTLLLEQPEIHLHPRLQMQLADYFIASALSKKNYIIETHSEHIINRIVRRIIEDNTGQIKNLIGIYFIELSTEGSVIQEVKIDENIGIVNWPKEFFDQVSNEQEKILMARLKKSLKDTSISKG